MPADSYSILVVDDRPQSAELVSNALAGLDVDLLMASSVAKGKQLLINKTPSLVVANARIGEDVEAGFTLCRELRSHPIFESLPLLIIAAGVSEETIRLASDCGASGLLDLSSPVSRVRKRLFALLGAEEPEVEETAPVANTNSTEADVEIEIELDVPAASQKKTRTPRPTEIVQRNSAVFVAPEGEATLDDKLKKAQHLMALVLHNLKTSNLLEVVELEDVPGVVLQIARTVCGDVKKVRDPQKTAVFTAPTSSPAAEEPETNVDIDSIFSKK